MFYSFFAATRIPAFFLLLSLIVTGFSACGTANQSENPDQIILPDQAENETSVPAPNINLANPLVISDKPEDVALCEKMNAAIEESPFANARWGVFVVSLKDGRVACSRDGRKLFNPASIQKVLTAIVALDKLGADFRWRTSLYAQNEIGADGTLSGDLVLYGQGAPDFDSAAMENLVSQILAKGLKSVKGKIIADESYFRGDPLGDGWTWNELQWYYGAEASAVSFNENQAFISVENGTPRASTDYIQVTIGEPNADSNANTEASGIKRGLSNNDFYVWGKARAFGARVAVHKPALMAAKALKEKLEKKGVTIEGAAESRDWKSAEKLDPANAVELAAVESLTLGEAVKTMNKRSHNLYAELILRTIGKKFGDTVAGSIQRPQDVRGDDTTGAAVIKKWLTEHHVATEEIQVYDGSGLSRLDFVTPEAFGRALIYAAQSAYAKAFTDSLPIAATDGTLGGRLGKAKGKIIAKTGSITFVSSLAGYAAAENGETFAFVIITNNETRKNGVTNVIDKIAAMIVGNEDEKSDEKQESSANANQANDFYSRSIANGNQN